MFKRVPRFSPGSAGATPDTTQTDEGEGNGGGGGANNHNGLAATDFEILSDSELLAALETHEQQRDAAAGVSLLRAVPSEPVLAHLLGAGGPLSPTELSARVPVLSLSAKPATGNRASTGGGGGGGGMLSPPSSSKNMPPPPTTPPRRMLSGRGQRTPATDDTNDMSTSSAPITPNTSAK